MKKGRPEEEGAGVTGGESVSVMGEGQPGEPGESGESGEPGEGCSTYSFISMLWHLGYQGEMTKGVEAGGKKGSGCEGREKKKKR